MVHILQQCKQWGILNTTPLLQLFSLALLLTTNDWHKTEKFKTLTWQVLLTSLHPPYHSCSPHSMLAADSNVSLIHNIHYLLQARMLLFLIAQVNIILFEVNSFLVFYSYVECFIAVVCFCVGGGLFLSFMFCLQFLCFYKLQFLTFC